MPRKSITDFLKEYYGGDWKFTFPHGPWVCEDGREVHRQKNCNCWAWGNDEGCKCKPKYILHSEEGQEEVQIDDHCIYRKNGLSTRPL